MRGRWRLFEVEDQAGHRGKGYGRGAMVLAEEEAQARGHRRIELNVFGGNDVARSLYRSLGFEEVAVSMGKSSDEPWRDRRRRRLALRVHGREARTLKDFFVQRGRTEPQDVWALRDVSAAIEPGEAVGLVGRNGSGKSTLLRIVAGIIKPTTGRVAAAGRIGSLLELGAGFHPDFTGRENVFLNGSIQGLPRRLIRERFDEIVAFAELEHAIDRPVRTYSSGMYMRLGFAIAAFLDADTLLLDEVFAVGDEAFQRKCFGRIFEFKQRGGTIVFVSHDAVAVERLCERAVLLQAGEVTFDGPAHEAIVLYRRTLAAEVDPAERGAGLREWGTGEAVIASARLLGPEGEEREQFLAGEPLTLAVAIEAREPVAAPLLQLELRDDSGLLIASDVAETRTLGWNGAGTLEAT